MPSDPVPLVKLTRFYFADVVAVRSDRPNDGQGEWRGIYMKRNEFMYLPSAVDQALAAKDETIAALQDKLVRVTGELVIAQHHKVLDRLGKSSYQEVVEQDLRTKLAETEVRAEQAEAELAAVRQQLADAQQGIENLQTLLKAAYANNRAAYDDRDKAELGALRARLATQTWQPIATAPKDEQILVSDGVHIESVCWSETLKTWLCVCTPTHWMPPPDPPPARLAHREQP